MVFTLTAYHTNANGTPSANMTSMADTLLSEDRAINTVGVKANTTAANNLRLFLVCEYARSITNINIKKLNKYTVAKTSIYSGKDALSGVVKPNSINSPSDTNNILNNLILIIFINNTLKLNTRLQPGGYSPTTEKPF